MSDIWWILLELAARAAILGLVAGFSLWLWRRRSPAAGHAVWVGVVLGMLALPLLTALAPRLPLGVLGAFPTERAVGLARPEPPAHVQAAALPSASTAIAASSSPAVLERLGSLSWTALLASLYLGVAAFMLLSLARGGILLRRLGRTAHQVEDPGLRTLAAELLPGRAVTILSSPAVCVPLTAGFLRPRVFLPAGWQGWSGEKRRAVLAHELAHVRRGDFLWTLLAELNKCLYWFHPLAWIARRRLAALAEEASDAAAVERLGSKTAYARILVEVAGLLRGRQGRVGALVTVPMASSSELGGRVEQVLRLSRSARSGTKRHVPIVASSALALLVLLTGTTDLVADPDIPERPAGIETLITELGHLDPGRRARAAYELALDESYWERAIPHLVALLADDAEIRDRPPRRRSLREGDRWTPAHLTWVNPSPGEVAVVSLASMSSRAAEPLIEALDRVNRRQAGGVF